MFTNIESVQFVLQNTTHMIIGSSSIVVFEKNRKHNNNLLYIKKYENVIKDYIVYAYPNFEEIRLIEGTKYDTMTFEDVIIFF